MKRLLCGFRSTGFKVVVTLVMVSFLCIFTIAMKAGKTADDVWKQLGITLTDARLNINYSAMDGFLHYQGAKLAKNIAMGDRVAVVNQIVTYAKKYVTSQEFLTAYKKERSTRKPATSLLQPITAESIKADEKLRLEQNLKIAEEGLNSPNPKIRNGAPLRIENIKKELVALDDPNNKTVKRRLEETNRSIEAANKIENEKMQKFEEKYPEDPKLLIKKRLQEILDITENIDYKAELKDGPKGFKYFVNPDYEKRSKDWKLAFRAGKTTTDAIRAAAQQWLKELN
jgi:hypothetical protein